MNYGATRTGFFTVRRVEQLNAGPDFQVDL
jgi:hypothetical protein